MKTIKEFTIKKGAYSVLQDEIKIPAGSPVEFIRGEYFISPSIFTGIDAHDAIYYGFRVDISNVEKSK